MKTYKTEIYPTQEQIIKLNQTIGVCRFLYNQFISYNKEVYEKEGKFVSGLDFDKYVNNELSVQEGFEWIKKAYGKARKKSIMNVENAFKRFFKELSKFPRFKKKRNQDVSFYAPRNNKGDLLIERHRIKVPFLGWVRLKEKGYLPVKQQAKNITITQKAGRYYISALLDCDFPYSNNQQKSEGIGIDLGIKEFAFASNGHSFRNINKTPRVRKFEKKLKREQGSLSRKYEFYKKKGGKSAAKERRNLNKNILRVQKLYQRLLTIREAYRQHVVSMMVKTKPSFITIEKLNVKGMMKNRHLAKSVANQGFYDFKQRLLHSCKKFGIELREVDTFYPSSKLCSCCRHKKVNLSLSDRIYKCDNCKVELNRDHHASLNLKQATKYVVLT
ncbi:RNA-guided endonuclease InsQ/TnpB family protein [Peribacillus sp. JNUCC 23]